MVGSEWMMLGSGILLLLLSGVWHLGGILLTQRLKPDPESHRFVGVLVASWGLAVLHFSEIALGALGYAIVLALPGAGTIHSGYGTDLAGLLYFSGITYTTLGLTGQTVEGPVQLLAMLPLGGFMLLTWSAAFVYSIWEEQFRNSREANGEHDWRKAGMPDQANQ